MARQKSTRSHSVPGQAAGYLFQPERALACLAKAGPNTKVGIECDDDIAVRINDVIAKREQLKHSITGKTPFEDNSSDLWKTFVIWLDAAKAKEFDPSSCQLILATNGTLEVGFVSKLIKCKGKTAKIDKCLTAFLAQSFPEGIYDYIDRLRAHDRSLILHVLACIQVVDASDASFGPELLETVASDLHLPGDIDKDTVITGLMGWIYSTTLALWRAGQPAWITKDAFDMQYHQLCRRMARYKRIGIPQEMVNVSEADIRQQRNTMFVRQLTIVHARETDKLGAINDYCRCNSERLRLASEGELSDDDWTDFDVRLQRHWHLVSGREQSSVPPRSPEAIGFATYLETIGHKEHLANDEPQPYLTAGSFHRLANDLTIGWHPDYATICKR